MAHQSCSSGFFPRLTTLQLLQEIQGRKIKFSLKSSEIESCSCRCTMTLIGEMQETQKFCMSNSSDVAAYARRFSIGHWSFLGPGTEEKWYGTHICKPNGFWSRAAGMMMIHLRESGHPTCKGTSALARGRLESRGGGGKTSIHYNADPLTVELLFRIIISVNQLSLYGAVADWCEELSQQISDHFSSSTGNLVAKVNDDSESKVSPIGVSILTKQLLINVPAQGNLVQQHKERFENLPEDIE